MLLKQHEQTPPQVSVKLSGSRSRRIIWRFVLIGGNPHSIPPLYLRKSSGFPFWKQNHLKSLDLKKKNVRISYWNLSKFSNDTLQWKCFFWFSGKQNYTFLLKFVIIVVPIKIRGTNTLWGKSPSRRRLSLVEGNDGQRWPVSWFRSMKTQRK